MSTTDRRSGFRLADNWWIDLNIALGNELATFSALYGVDVLDVIAAANTIPDGKSVVNILSPMLDYTAQLTVHELTKLGKNPAAAKVAVLGLAFKNNTGDLRATPTLAVVTALTKTCAEVSIFDPLVDVAEAEERFGLRPAGSLDEAVKGADCIAILAPHRSFSDIDFATLPVAKSCLILDGLAFYPKEKVAALRGMGYAYRGVGRPAST